MKKWFWTILNFVTALLVVGGGLFFLFYNQEALLMYGALAAVLCAAFIFVTIGLAYMPNKDEKKEKENDESRVA